jgi:hypothetical protein
MGNESEMPSPFKLTCEFGYALERYVIDYYRLRASFGVNGEENQSIGAA